MEFFRIINIQTTEEEIQEKVVYENLDQVMPTLFMIAKEDSHILAGTAWGEFNLSLNKIKGGIRMSLLDCPNALSWSITTGYPPERNKIVLHLTINRTRKPTSFIQEINDFMNDWEEGLQQGFKPADFKTPTIE